MTTKLTVQLEPVKLVRVTSNDGGYLGGDCLVCDEGGWINGPDCVENLGTDRIDKGLTNQLLHRVFCPVGEYIIGRRLGV